MFSRVPTRSNLLYYFIHVVHVDYMMVVVELQRVVSVMDMVTLKVDYVIDVVKHLNQVDSVVDVVMLYQRV